MRFLDEALTAPWVDGVSFAFEEAGLRLRFVVRDPSGQAELVVVRQVIVDDTATEAFLNGLNTEYEMHRLSREVQSDPDEPSP